MQVVVTGATGFVGRLLCPALLAAGHQVTALSRDPDRARAALGSEVQSVAWGTEGEAAWMPVVANAEAIIHLAGEPIAGRRWTPDIKTRVLSSRVVTTRNLVEAIRRSGNPSTVLVSTSAIGYYGDRKDEILTEESPPGNDFLADVCKAWEAEAEKAVDLGVRTARMRIGIVLGRDGGPLQEMLYPLPLPISPWKLGLGGPLASGKQWISWIHIEDVVGMLLWAATNPAVHGAVNTTAPNPVTNADFSRTLGHVLHRPAFLPVPGFALKALIGEFADVLLTGQKVLPVVAERLGYSFRYPDVETALRSLLST